MAENNLFRITNKQAADGSITATIVINKNSEILMGHFPGRPVVPGACLLQLVKDVLEEGLNTTLRLNKATQLKFIRPVLPENNTALSITLRYEYTDGQKIKATAELADETLACFKFLGIFTL